MGADADWRDVLLEELAAPTKNALVGGPFGSDLVSSDYSPTGIPVIRGENLSTGRWVDGSFVYVPTAKAQKLAANTAGPLDLVFTQRGANHYRQVALVPADAAGRFVISQSQMKLTVDQGKTDPLFVYYLFRSPIQQEYLRRNAIQTGVPHTNLSILRKVPLRVPSLPTQRAIVHILGALDDKIELNQRMNETLESTAGAIFNSWFVDFDPVRAKAEGRDSDLPEPLARLFPDSFEESELGGIPTGWEVTRFADTVDIIGGGTPATSVAAYWDGDIPWFSVVDAPGNSDVWVMSTAKKITREGVENSSTRVLPVGTTIISARGTVGRIALVGVPMAMNQSCYGLRGMAGGHGFFTYYVTRELVTRLQQHAHGSVFDTITQNTLRGVSVALPPATLIEAFEARVGPELERIRVNLLCTGTLAALRDALLPKLISGELRVKDAENFAAKVA